MLNISQSNKGKYKISKQKNNECVSLEYKISQPKIHKDLKSKQMTTLQSINMQSDTGCSIYHKNTARSFSQSKLQDQYISFKIKPSTGQENKDKQKFSNILKEGQQKIQENKHQKANNVYKLKNNEKQNKVFKQDILNREQNNFYYYPSQQSIQVIKRSQMGQLSKSPQFVCKVSSQNSSKQQFEQEQNKYKYQVNNYINKINNYQMTKNNQKLQHLKNNNMNQQKDKYKPSIKDQTSFSKLLNQSQQQLYLQKQFYKNSNNKYHKLNQQTTNNKNKQKYTKDYMYQNQRQKQLIQQTLNLNDSIIQNVNNNYINDDSVINQNFQQFQICTPYKQLHQQFQKQSKLYQKQIQLHTNKNQQPFYAKYNNSFQKQNYKCSKSHRPYQRQTKINHIHEFDSFSLNPPLKKQQQYQLEDNYRNSNHKILNNLKSISKPKSNYKFNQTNQQKGFFFLTNPLIQSQKKPSFHHKSKEGNLKRQIQQNSKNKQSQINNKPQFYYQQSQPKKQVKQFCYSLSSINPSFNTLEQHNKNLFSNSNQQLLFFDTKPNSNNYGSFGSKKIHIRQLVQQFVDQLQNLDQKSLNQKNVIELQDVLESIVFKEPKDHKSPIKIINQNQYPNYHNANHSRLNKSKSPQFQTQTKKWNKIAKEPNSSSIATQRKTLSEFQNLQNKLSIQKKQNKYSFNIDYSNKKNNSNKKDNSNKKVSQKFLNKSPDSSNKNTQKKQIKKQTIYKPNFSMCESRQKRIKSQSKDKQNFFGSKAFTNLKNKNDPSMLIKINPKSSIYVKKGPKTSRQNIKTQSHMRSGWRMY